MVVQYMKYSILFSLTAFIIQIIGLLLLVYMVTGTELLKYSKFLQTIFLLDLILLFNNNILHRLCILITLVILIIITSIIICFISFDPFIIF